MSRRPKAIFAYFVGIGAYVDPRHHLTAPKDDVAYMQELIDTSAKRSKVSVCTNILLDHNATRDNVVTGFELFQDVREDDLCVFYYSGHGSRILAPYFLNQSNNLTESLVCQNSRTPGGLDLADKELAFLLHKYFQNKGSQVILLMDCCHAGGNSRSIYVKDKMAEESLEERALATFLGQETYPSQMTDSGVRYSVAPAPHMHMAACASEETAKEMEFDGKAKSVFTHFLFEALTQTNKPVTYAQVMSEVRLRTGQFVSFQTPEIQTIGLDPIEKHRLFLDGAWRAPTTSYHLFKDRKAGWCLNAGQIDGVSENDYVMVENLADKLPVMESMIQQSRIGNSWNLDPTQMYPCIIKRETLSEFLFATMDSCPKGIRDQIKENMALNKSEHWSFSDEVKKATHLITKNASQLLLVKKDDYVPGEDLSEVALLAQKFDAEDLNRTTNSLMVRLHQWSKFHNILNHRNPYSEIDLDAIQLQVKVKEIRNTGEFGSSTAKNIDQIIELPQQMVEGRPHGSQLSLEIQNTSDIPLWASAQVLGPGWDPDLDVSTSWNINNRFMQSECIQPNERKSLIDFFDGTAYTDIPFYVAEDYIEHHGDEAKTYIKLWIATEPIDTDRMNDLGLPVDTDYFGPMREVRKSLDPFEPDWQTFTITLLIKNIH